MDELRNAIIEIQKNQDTFLDSENAMNDVINRNCATLNSLKNFIHTLIDRIGVLENMVKSKKDETVEHIEKMESVKKKMVNIDEKIDSVQDNLEEVTKINNLKLEKQISESDEKHKSERELLKRLFEENKQKIEEVERNMKIQKKNSKKQERQFYCEECGKYFPNKLCLRKHVKQDHPKTFKCETCDALFTESWQLETHLESHTIKAKENKCDICGKEFFLKWRFKQHMNVHQNPNIKPCHYFNNNKACPFEPIGCKFKHVEAIQCKNKTTCKNKLCPLQHQAS